MATQRCLYEILGVEATSSNEEIRSAYRKLALKWHPDKIQQSGASVEACQEATIQFQEILRAYEVLADPSERSWYDSHRTQILSSSSSFSSDFDFNPWPFFSASVFAGYGDTGKGFYAVYSDLFNKLHQQEVGFARAHGVRAPFDPPDMGNLTTPYSQVQGFYNHWLGFSTVKDFSWCDEYKSSAGPNRKLRRLMEEENKKIRSKARKEFNETIRRLAAFVRKRDKRVLERQIEVQRLEREKEELRKARRKRDEEEKMMKAKLYEEAEWTKVEEDDDADEGSDFDDSIGSYAWRHTKSSTDRKGRQDEFYCIVCSKKFRSDEQWKNHERSKKHLEKLAILKESLEEDDKEFEVISHGSMQEDDMSAGARASLESLSEGELTSASEIGDKSALNADVHDKEKVGTPTSNVASRDHAERDADESLKDVVEEGSANTNESESHDVSSEGEDGGDDELSSLLTMVNSYSSRQQQSASDDSDIAVELSVSRRKEGDEDDEGEDEEMFAAMLKSRQIRQDFESDENGDNACASSSTLVLEEDRIDKPNGDIGGLSKKKKSKGRLRNEKQQAASLSRHSSLMEEVSLRKKMDNLTQKCETLEVNEEDSSCLKQEVDGESAMLKDRPFISKADKVERRSPRESSSSKGKNTNGHATVEIEQLRKPTRGKKSKGNAKSTTNTCETCGEDFETRNQLFKHISVTKHAMLRGK